MSNPRSRPSSTASRSSSLPAGWAAASAALHAAILAALLIGLPRRPLPPPDQGPTVELRLVETKGPNGPVPGAAAPLPAPAPQQAPAAPPAPPQPQTGRVASSTVAPLPPAPAPQPASPARPAPRMEVNLGGGDSLTNAVATGPSVRPAGIDPRYRNREPVYPSAAAARGEHGTVILLIHIDQEGGVTGVDVARTSGYDLLDRAAREAVERWHFMPAVRDGAPVPSEMPLRVVFALN